MKDISLMQDPNRLLHGL